MKKLALLPIMVTLSAASFAADPYLANIVGSNTESITAQDAEARLLFQHDARLSQGQSSTATLDAKAGQTYTVFANCDVDCSNINLSITQGRNVLFSERGSADDPRFSWKSEQNGRVGITTEMVSCNDARCRTTLQVFSGGQVSNSNTLAEALQSNRNRMQLANPAVRELPLINGTLPEGESATANIELAAGNYYAFFAVCDKDCGDIDLALLHDGKSIVANTESDNQPSLQWKAEQSGSYQLKASVEDCDSDKCAYTIQAFESDKDIDTSLADAHRTNTEIVNGNDPDARELLLRQSRLALGQRLTERVQLTAGKAYTFYGDCDSNCTDIDLIVSRNGRTVKQDTDNDSVPLFSWRATRTGTYTVTLPMKECSAATCSASIHIFEGSKLVYPR